MAKEMRAAAMARSALLCCGLLAAPAYVGADLLAAARYSAYHRFGSQAISELSAVGAPSKPLVDPFDGLYQYVLTLVRRRM